MDEGDSITDRDTPSASTKPCHCLELAIKSLLACLGLDSIFKDPPSNEDEKKVSTEADTSTSRGADVSTLLTTLDARRRPARPVMDPGSGGQIN